mgnify:CR=1 FL=1
MNYNKATFDRAFGISAQLPPADGIEIAFAGRSNVGKSSLLNRLFNRKSLARVSSVPGKTVTVNFYDVDGVHFDYLRYPENAPLFPDKYDFRRYNKGRTLDQWRRDNISEIVRYIYKGVKAMKPWVKLSASPVGKYRDTSRYPSRGWNAFFTVYQDPQGWLGEGIMDQIYPMMYFQGNSFYPFALDWQEQSNGRQVIPGLGIYFLHPDEGKWTRDEIDRQINFIRNHKMAGEGHYRVKYLMENTQGIYDELIENFYAYPALQPPMPWLDNVPPTAPSELKVRTIDSGYTELKW